MLTSLQAWASAALGFVALTQSNQPSFPVFGFVCLQQGFSGTQIHTEVLQQQNLYSNKSYADKAQQFVVYETVREATHTQKQALVNVTPDAILPLLCLQAIILAILLVVRMRPTLLKPQGTAAYAL